MASGKGFLDLVDFFDRWPEERQKLMAVVKTKSLTDEEAELLETMILIMDRVGPADLQN
ncbi:hypothetical protein MWU54_04715 [Marivita sp. S6314]|uniref:hypothetical protein n=1 Tax=Marivita sp. S6314 TaxID=2926406 RepID=UPI001FF26E30|nr:hypothetical protein [Marivita sp. S6314]MCK0149314.1 hypothetical protein [Marivita sp. S6314]